MSELAFSRYLAVAMGIGDTEHSERSPPKSISTQRTFSDTSDLRVLRDMCGMCMYSTMINDVESMAISVHEDLERQEMKAKTITVVFKRADFTSYSRSVTLPSHTCDYDVRGCDCWMSRYRRF